MKLLLSFAIVALVLTGGCPGPTPKPVQDIIDCTRLEGSQAWNQAQVKLTEDVASGSWAKLLTDVESLGVQFGIDTTRCIAMELLQQYLSTKQTDIAGTHDAHDAGEQIRVKAGGATFHTKFGDL